ncbi:MAG: HAD family hydrolase [Elusimicrobiales bacterium]|nr:HAD family hydrolase [Elusimicrobiales bacterium]
MKHYKNYIFDFDGTVAHTSPEILHCLAKACEQAGTHVDKSELTGRLIGPALPQIIKMLFPDILPEKSSEIVKNFRYLYDNHSFGLTKLYPGVKDKILALKNSGCTVFIATNKAKKALFRLIKELEIEVFDDIYAVDRYEKPSSKAELVSFILKEHNLNKEESLMIGDNPGDIKAGAACGIDTAAALWGYAEGAAREQISSEASYKLNSIEELP